MSVPCRFAGGLSPSAESVPELRIRWRVGVSSTHPSFMSTLGKPCRAAGAIVQRPTADGRAVATQCGSFLAGPARALGGHVPLAAADQRAGACGCPSLTPWAPLRPRCRLCARVSTGAMLEWTATRFAAARPAARGSTSVREYSRMGQGTPRGLAVGGSAPAVCSTCVGATVGGMGAAGTDR